MDNDMISRQAAIDGIKAQECDSYERNMGLIIAMNVVGQLPSAQPEEDCDTCKHGYFMDAQCERCRVRYPSHYEREVEHHGSD